ncbi:MAG TPA: HAD family hydrolase [Spirochaetota bacterium]|nr:HAD family hydrolase [Spirochaetota bacterium]HNT11683.1 HAD family hydrolase [Spirochaetota bacterium]
MDYKGILLDIDNTLYHYEPCHRIAIERALTYLSHTLSRDPANLGADYREARRQVHGEHAGTAAMHNRLLYFQRLLELIGVNAMEHALDAYNAYWDSFLEAMRPFEGVFDFLRSVRERDVRVCLLTDLTAHIQHRKVRKLELWRYVDYLVTSEEAGAEKPAPGIFLLGLEKMSLCATEVCMVGDNFDADIVGAVRLGIGAFWLTRSPGAVPPGVVPFGSFSDLGEYFT